MASFLLSPGGNPFGCRFVRNARSLATCQDDDNALSAPRSTNNAGGNGCAFIELFDLGARTHNQPIP